MSNLRRVGGQRDPLKVAFREVLNLATFVVMGYPRDGVCCPLVAPATRLGSWVLQFTGGLDHGRLCPRGAAAELYHSWIP
jgi:hypothetical protein